MDSNTLSLNSLRQRKRLLALGKSSAHGTGLFIAENVPVHEFVVEYVGEVIRRPVSDLREVKYQQAGIGDSYLFRLYNDLVLDATRKGYIARYINHSCQPNIYAKTIRLDGN